MRALFIASLLICGIVTAQAAVIEQTSGAVTMRRQDVDIDWCEDCIQGMVMVINEVLNEILNGGIIGNCAELCQAALPGHGNKVYRELCNGVCDVYGLENFVTYLKNNPPNPLLWCQLADQQCPILDCVAPTCVNITTFNAVPSSIKNGQKFNLNLIYKVLSAAGAGMLRLEIWPGSDKANGQVNDFLMESYPVGSFPLAFNIDSSQLGATGPWQAKVLLCEGDCSWIKRNGPHTRLLAQAQTTFTINA